MDKTMYLRSHEKFKLQARRVVLNEERFLVSQGSFRFLKLGEGSPRLKPSKFETSIHESNSHATFYNKRYCQNLFLFISCYNNLELYFQISIYLLKMNKRELKRPYYFRLGKDNKVLEGEKGNMADRYLHIFVFGRRTIYEVIKFYLCF